MTNRLIFLRHAETQKDPAVHTSQWVLSKNGRLQAEEIGKSPLMDTVDVMYASEEPKTTLTVEPLAKRLQKEIYTYAAFNEVQRGEKFLSAQEFEVEKARQLQDLTYRAFDGESGIEALTRFKQGIDKVVLKYPNQTILIVTHGTILNIYFAELLDKNSELADRWNKIPFCAIGIVEDWKVIKDIV